MLFLNRHSAVLMRSITALVLILLAGCGKPLWREPLVPAPEHCRSLAGDTVQRGASAAMALIGDYYVASFWGVEQSAWKRPAGALLDLGRSVPGRDSSGIIRLSWDSVVSYRYDGSGPTPVPDTLRVLRRDESLVVPHPSRGDTLVLRPDSASSNRFWGGWTGSGASGWLCASRPSHWFRRREAA